MEHSEKFELVKGYYESGQWSKKAVFNVTAKQWITPEEYEEITGEPFDPADIDANEADFRDALEGLGI